MEEDGGCLGTGWSGGGGLLLILKLHEVLQSSLLGVSVSPFLHFFFCHLSLTALNIIHIQQFLSFISILDLFPKSYFLFSRHTEWLY